PALDDRIPMTASANARRINVISLTGRSSNRRLRFGLAATARRRAPERVGEFERGLISVVWISLEPFEQNILDGLGELQIAANLPQRRGFAAQSGNHQLLLCASVKRQPAGQHL